jgi:1,4-alpha-glucan branching enzyme
VLAAGTLRQSREHRLQVLPLAGARFPADPRTFDLVHLHSLALAELGLELHRRFGLRIVYTVHSLIARELDPGPVARLWSAVQESLLAICHELVFLSSAERSAALATRPELAAHSSVIANAVPAPPPAVPHDRRSQGPIVFAGRFTGSKGVALLAEIVPRLVALHPVQVVIAGGHGDDAGEQTIGRLAASCPQVVVRGWLPRAELDRLFAGAALVLVPSRYEPFGLVALEAMRMGAPVLAAAVGGLCETVGPASGGCLVYSDDPEQWTAQALAILNNPQLSRSLACRGPRWAARFSPRRIASRLTAVYARAIKGASSSCS